MPKIVALLLFTAAFLFASKTYAATVDAGVLEISYSGSGALFNETNIAPGFEVIKTVSVKNTGRSPHSFSIAVSGQLGKLAEVLQIEPRNYNTGLPIWNKTINNIAKTPNSDLILGSIAPGETRQVNIAAILPESVGNDYQDTSTFAFDFVVGNESTDPSEPIGNLNIDSVISTSLGNVAALRANGNVNSNTANENSNGSSVGENTNATTFVSNSDQGEAKGTATSSEKECFWWWILWIVLAVLLIAYKKAVGKSKEKFFIVWPAFFGVFIYVVHWILHDYYHPSKWCHWWFVAILLAEIAVYYVVRYKNREQGTSKNNKS